MSMTEAEALHKWCPFSQVAVTPSDDIVANTLSGKAVTCAASGCMAWRWSEQTFRRDTELWSKSKNKRVNSAWGDDAEWRPVGPKADAEPPEATGYCGLAEK